MANTNPGGAQPLDAQEKIPGADLHYYLLAYDEGLAERTDHPAGIISKHVLDALRNEPITDVFLFSHGWRGDVPGAREQYQGWLKVMADRSADRERIRQLSPAFRPLLVGLHWPSEPWGDETLALQQFGVAEATIGAIEAQVEDFAVRLGDSPDVRKPLRVILTAARTTGEANKLPREVLNAYHDLDAAVALPRLGIGGPPGADWEGLDAEGIYEDSRKNVPRDNPVAFGFSLRDSLLTPLRVLSFWKMKDRARQFGEGTVHPLLQKMRAASGGRDVRFHLAGHSFGCIVASAAVAGSSGSGDHLPVNSLTLLQGALSLWSYCEDIPHANNTGGYFHRIVAKGLVRGPIVASTSKFDSAVGTWYPRAARTAGQVVFGIDEFPKYGAVGAFGTQGPGLQIQQAQIRADAGNYGFTAGNLYNINADSQINQGGGLSGAHSDIRKPAVAHLVWQAIEAGVRET